MTDLDIPVGLLAVLRPEAVRLFESLPEDGEKAETVRIVRRHLEIIERFGRFPHRNKALGRTSTPAEEAFLKEPESSF